MTIAQNLAKHFREVFFGGNWTWVNLKETLDGITWEQATQQVESFNTIARLTYHIGYFVQVALQVLEGGPLEGHDKFSFDHPPVAGQGDWDALVEKLFANAEKFAVLTAALPDERLHETFVEEKYGTWYRNIAGIIEHTHYHMGQIVILKKMVQGASLSH